MAKKKIRKYTKRSRYKGEGDGREFAIVLLDSMMTDFIRAKGEERKELKAYLLLPKKGKLWQFILAALNMDDHLAQEKIEEFIRKVEELA